jgi:glycine/D-amino acid oxidase-like deaminating enzyme
MANNNSNITIPLTFEVVIVGAGVAGASALYHLSEAGVSDMILIDSGAHPGEGLLGAERRSGTAVMEAAPTVKMMVQVFASSSQEFISHHGTEGARRYLAATREGLNIQKELAKGVALESPSDQLKELGSFYIGYADDEEELQNEFELLQSLGCNDIEWYDEKMLGGVDGCSPDFHCAIFFPSDGVIDSSSYAKGLVRAVQEQGSARLLMNSKVSRISEENITSNNGECKYKALIELDSGTIIRCQHVVIATGGLFQMQELCGVLKPCYSYLVHVPVVHPHDSKEDLECCESSSNFFTWGFSHDWCFTNGKVRTSGEDHFSAYKDPKCKERCDNLIQWTLEKYGCNPSSVSSDDIPHQHGIYSETPDCVPLVGSINPNSNAICYLLGCNAWGQTVLSYSSSLIPGLLGYRPLTESQRDNLELLSIHRFPFLH